MWTRSKGGGGVVKLKIMLIVFIAWLGVLCLYSEGKIMGPVGVKSKTKNRSGYMTAYQL